MPTNYRQIDYRIRGKNIKIAGMAKPGYRDTTAAEDIKFLADNHYTTIISLNPSDTDKTLATKSHPPIEYIQQYVVDFTPPSIEQLEAIYDRISAGVTTAGEKVCIHCGEGFGRTGTVLAALKLKELMMAIPVNQLNNEKTTTAVDLGHYADKPGLFTCTPMVKKAIEEVRSYQGSSHSVEKEGQVNQLQNYQRFLVQKLKEDYLSKNPSDAIAVSIIRQAEILVKEEGEHLGKASEAAKKAAALELVCEQRLIDSAQLVKQLFIISGPQLDKAKGELENAQIQEQKTAESAGTYFGVFSDAVLSPIANFLRKLRNYPPQLTYNQVHSNAKSTVASAQINVDKVNKVFLEAMQTKKKADAALAAAKHSKTEADAALAAAKHSKTVADAALVALAAAKHLKVKAVISGKQTLPATSIPVVQEKQTSKMKAQSIPPSITNQLKKKFKKLKEKYFSMHPKATSQQPEKKQTPPTSNKI